MVHSPRNSCSATSAAGACPPRPAARSVASLMRSVKVRASVAMTLHSAGSGESVTRVDASRKLVLDLVGRFRTMRGAEVSRSPEVQ